MEVAAVHATAITPKEPMPRFADSPTDSPSEHTPVETESKDT